MLGSTKNTNLFVGSVIFLVLDIAAAALVSKSAY